MRTSQPFTTQRLVFLIGTSLWLLFIGSAYSTAAQNNASGALVGQVFAPDGSTKAGIPVTATNKENRLYWTRTTDSRGYYRFEYLPPGDYKVKASGLNKYPDVTITSIAIAHPKTKELRAPDITLGRVSLIIQIANRNRTAAVTVTNGSEIFETYTQDGECRFLYLRDGKWRIDIYIGGRKVGTHSLTIQFEDKFEDKRQFDSTTGRFIGQIFELNGPVVTAFEKALANSGQESAVTDTISNGVSPSDTTDGASLTQDAADTAAKALILPTEISQTGDGTPLTYGVVKLFSPKGATSPTIHPHLPQATSSSTTVTGPAGVSVVNGNNVARSSNFPEKQIQSLPLGGGTEMRTYDELVFLVPGVVPPPYTYSARGPGIGFGANTAGDFSANGARARSNNFTVDGSDNNDPDVGGRRQGFVALVPQSLESIKAFSLSTLLWNGELGRNLGSQVNAVSKYGEDRYHGQAYAFLTSSRLNARNFFDYRTPETSKKEPFTRAQQGFTLGGPLIQGSTYLFGSLEYVKTSALSEQHFSTPGTNERRFLPSRARGGQFGVDPFSADANQLFVTADDRTPLGQLILHFYPLPSATSSGPFGANTYTQSLPADSKGTIFSLKPTHQFAPNYLLNVRYNYTDDRRILPSINRAIRSTTEANSRTQDVSALFDGLLGHQYVSQTRFSYGRTRLGFTQRKGNEWEFSGTEMFRTLGLNNGEPFPATTGRLGQVIIEPFSPVGVDVFTIPQSRVNNTFQLAESVAHSIGAHAFRFGGEWLHFQFNSLQNRNYRPQAIYGYAIQAEGVIRDVPANTRNSGDPSLSFTEQRRQIIPGAQLAALGVASSILQTLTTDPSDSNLKLRFSQFGFFATDNWKLRSNLTLDYGLRYSYNTVPHEADGLIESALRLEGLATPCATSPSNDSRTEKFNSAVRKYCEILAGRRRMYDPDHNNFGPHFGFAWAPKANERMVIRAGYGLYYGVILGAVVSQSRNIFPREVSLNVDPLFIGFNVFNLNNPSLLGNLDPRQLPFGLPNPPLLPLIARQSLNQLAGGRDNFATLVGELFQRNGAGGGLAFTLPNKNLPTPYTQQWHVTIERLFWRETLLSVAYVGTKGTKLTRLTTPNGGPLVTAYLPIARALAGDSPYQFPTVSLFTSVPNKPHEKTSLALQPSRFIQDLGPYQIFENSAASHYQALQIEARKQLARNYNFTAAYTWSHAIDDVSDIFPVAGASNLAQDSFHLREERASANFDIRHRLAISLIWDVPLYHNRSHWRARIFSAWQLSSIFQAHSSQPFTLHVPFDANQDGNLTDRPATTEGLLFCANSPSAPSCFGQRVQRIALVNGKTVADFFVQGKNGVVGRNTLRGDSFISWDVALNRKFQVSEGQELTFRAEFFNVANRANFGLPIRTIGNPGFGRAVETVNPARLIQFALKYSFGQRSQP